MHQLAQGLAALGRGPDTTLVHMSQPEVDALQTMALAGGGSLTINPQTGLAEAGFLSTMLPIAGTIIGSMYGMPWLGAAMSGMGTYMATGDAGKALGAGIGSWATGQAFGALAGAGANPMDAATANAITSQGATVPAVNEAMQGIQAATVNPVVDFGQPAMNPQYTEAFNDYGNPMTVNYGAAAANPQAVAQQMSPYQAPEQVFDPTMRGGDPSVAGLPAPYNPNANYTSTAYQGMPGAQPTFANAGKGVAGLGSEAGRSNVLDRMWGGGHSDASSPIKNYATLGAAGLGAYNTVSGISNAMGPQQGLRGPPPPAVMGRSQYTYDQQRNPNFGQPGEPYFLNQRFTPVAAAGGGLMSDVARQQYKKGGEVLPKYRDVGAYPAEDADEEEWQRYLDRQARIDRPEVRSAYRYNTGGSTGLGAYKAEGLLDGPGDGVSDSIPAVIAGAKPQPAALAVDEFVVPARDVSEIGNGSTKAGAARLYAMLDRIEKARKTVKRGGDSGAHRMLPA